MALHDRQLRVAVGHNFMVEPRARPTLAAVALLRALLSGPHDLVLAQSPETVARLWERLGGVRLALFSGRWTRAVSPAGYAVTKLAGPVGRLVLPFLQRGCAAVDRLAAGRVRLGAHPPRPAGGTSPLSARSMLETLPDVTAGHALRPDYDPADLAWRLRVLEGKRRLGVLRCTEVFDDDGKGLGWYLYFARRGGVAEVVQVAARSGGMDTVLGHLFHDAWQQGAVAVSGQIEPRLVPALARAVTLLHPANDWLLAHSPHPEAVRALTRGDAFLSRLDGEWWIN
jgi:hypothetical protein